MKKKLWAWTMVVLVSLAAAGQMDAMEEQAEREAVKKAIEQSIGWAIERDFDAMFRLWADNMFHFWLFSDSIVVGLERMKKHSEQWRDPDFRGTRFEFRDLRIVFSRGGEVAWYSCFLDDCYSYKGKESCLKNVFQTGVLEKRDGRWQHVLMHGSYPVDKIPENYVRRFYSHLFEKAAFPQGENVPIADVFQVMELAAGTDFSIWQEKKKAEIEGYAARTGTRLEIDASARPLSIRIYDPLDIELLEDGAVYHRVIFAAGNETGSLRIANHPCLTWFDDSLRMTRLVLNGLKQAPEIVEGEKKLILKADGFSVELPFTALSVKDAVYRVKL